MSQNSQLSRYGAISRAVPDLAPGAKMFLVCDSDDTTVGPLNLGAEYPVDKDGVVRVYTTIQAANNAAAVGRNDVALVMPGFSYDLAGADSWNTAGLQVIGLGQGKNAPKIKYTATGSTIGLGASNVRVSNLRFQSGVSAVVRGLSLDTGFTGQKVDNCVFEQDTVNTNFKVMLRLASQNAVIENNQFLGTDCESDSKSCGSGIRMLGGEFNYSTIKNNFFYGQFDTTGDSNNGGAAIAHDTTNTDKLFIKGVLIKDNVIVSTDTAVGAAIRFSAGWTNRAAIVSNRIMSNDSAGTDTVLLAAAGASFSGNYVSRQDTNEHIVGDVAYLFSDSGYTS